jgi:signal peptidase I
MGSGNANRPSPLFLRLIFGRNPAWTVVRILFVVFLSLAVFKFVLVPIQVNKLAYNWSEPQRGDIVAAYYAGEQVLLLKRIVAMPGETVRLKNGEVYINNRKLIEPYAEGKIPFEKGLAWMDPKPLGPDEYLVIGDNRKISEGYFKYRRELIGKVL